MKKSIMILLATALLLFAVGCGGEPAADSASEAIEVSEEGSIKGTVADATMNTVTIQAPNGSEYTFTTEGAEISSADGILIGDEITIQYTGAFDDSTQVQNVTVNSIVVESSAQSTAPPAESEEPEAPAEAPVEDVKSLQGTIDQYDGDTMMVVDATGVDFLFSLDGADLHVGSEGFAVGDEVIVYYYGELVDKPDVQDVQVGEVKKADQ